MPEKEDLFEELDEKKPERKQKALIEIQDDWPFWQRFAANVINLSPIFIWIALGFTMMWFFSYNPELVGLRNAYLNLVVPSSFWTVLTLISGVSLFAWLFPYFNVRKIMKTGTPFEKGMCMGLFGMVAIAIAIVVASVV